MCRIRLHLNVLLQCLSRISCFRIVQVHLFLYVLVADCIFCITVIDNCLELGLLLNVQPLLHCEQLCHCEVCAPHELDPADEFEFVLRELVSHVRQFITPCMTLNTASVAPCHKAQTLETKLDTRKESNWDALQSHGHLGLAVRIVVVDLVIIVFNFRFRITLITIWDQEQAVAHVADHGLILEDNDSCKED